MNPKVMDWVVLAVVVILGSVVLSTNAVLLHGLFDEKVNNDRIFAIIGPAFQTVIGTFGGILGGYALGRGTRPPPPPPPPPEIEKPKEEL